MLAKGYKLPVRADGKKTFNKIIKTAVDLFSKQGYFSTSINEIIETAGIATGTFYLYFNDKKVLYLYLVELYGNEIKKSIHESIANCTNRYDEEKFGIKAFLLYALNNPISYRIFWEAMYVDFEVFKNYYQDFSKRYIRGLQRGVIDNEVRDNIDLETLSYVLMGISNFVGLQVLFNKNSDENTVDYLTNEIMTILKNGMFI